MACAALVETVKGLVVLALPGPYVVVHVVSAFGMVATNPAHDAPAATPALITTVLMLLPFGAQYIVNDQMPAATVCAGRLISDQTPTAPLRRHALALAPGVGSRD